MSARPDSPYKGLTAFDDSELDALLFFGREREREIVVANLIASRLTVLYGPSGVGKSSLLRASVARSLRELPEAPLVVVFSSWSDDPAAALAQAVAEAVGDSSAASLEIAIAHAQRERDVYLILDQVEEYFLYQPGDEPDEPFARALPSLLAGPSRVNALVSLREDALAKLDRFAGRIPGLFGNTLRLDRLDRESARAAIVRPPERYGELTGEPVSLEPELVEDVLDQVSAGRIEAPLAGLGAVEGAESSARIEAPYLQLVMQRIWDEERADGSNVLRAATLERLGGAQRIVEEHLERAMSSLSPAQRDVAARIFGHLVTPSGTKIAHEESDLVAFAQVDSDDLRPVLDALVRERILRSDEDGRGRSVRDLPRRPRPADARVAGAPSHGAGDRAPSRGTSQAEVADAATDRAWNRARGGSGRRAPVRRRAGTERRREVPRRTCAHARRVGDRVAHRGSGAQPPARARVGAARTGADGGRRAAPVAPQQPRPCDARHGWARIRRRVCTEQERRRLRRRGRRVPRGLRDG